ncbi:hypothetical protein [Salinispora arenicola]|uniref:hypothetical protein n=1 Tax=Salinispora arenicola TaxID=168697 RepID=UPI000381FF29|nr:hypothetical protein [Salinispora arenicola]
MIEEVNVSNAKIEALSERLAECFGACAAAPDDRAAGDTADQVLAELEQLLRRSYDAGASS